MGYSLGHIKLGVKDKGDLHNHTCTELLLNRELLLLFGAASVPVTLAVSAKHYTIVIHDVQGCPRFARIAGRGTWHAGGTPITPTAPTKQMATCYLCA